MGIFPNPPVGLGPNFLGKFLIWGWGEIIKNKIELLQSYSQIKLILISLNFF